MRATTLMHQASFGNWGAFEPQCCGFLVSFLQVEYVLIPCHIAMDCRNIEAAFVLIRKVQVSKGGALEVEAKLIVAGQEESNSPTVANPHFQLLEVVFRRL